MLEPEKIFDRMCEGCKRRQEILSRWVHNMRHRLPKYMQHQPVDLKVNAPGELAPAEEVQVGDRSR